MTCLTMACSESEFSSKINSLLNFLKRPEDKTNSIRLFDPLHLSSII